MRTTGRRTPESWRRCSSTSWPARRRPETGRVPPPMRAANAVPGFRPSVHGLRFGNRFPTGPTLTFAGLDPRRIGFGDAAAGLCGGMALTARDLFEAGVPAPD